MKNIIETRARKSESAAPTMAPESMASPVTFDEIQPHITDESASVTRANFSQSEAGSFVANAIAEATSTAATQTARDTPKDIRYFFIS